MSILQDLLEIKSTPKELRSFGLTVGAVFCLIAGWIFWRHRAVPAVPVLLTMGSVLIILGSLLPRALWPIQKIWMGLALCMGFVMTRVILGVLYFAAITPIALILKAQGKDVIDQRPDPKAASHWKDHAPPDPKGPYRQF